MELAKCVTVIVNVSYDFVSELNDFMKKLMLMIKHVTG